MIDRCGPKSFSSNTIIERSSQLVWRPPPLLVLALSDELLIVKSMVVMARWKPMVVICYHHCFGVFFGITILELNAVVITSISLLGSINFDQALKILQLLSVYKIIWQWWSFGHRQSVVHTSSVEGSFATDQCCSLSVTSIWSPPVSGYRW
jgi:hypothetical protein